MISSLTNIHSDPTGALPFWGEVVPKGHFTNSCASMNQSEPQWHEPASTKDREIALFQGHVIRAVNASGSSLKPADSGINKAPILYDATSGKPVGIIKGEKGRFNSWLYMAELGDVLAFKLDHGGFAGVPPAFEIRSLEYSNDVTLEHADGIIVKWIPDTHCNSFGETKRLDKEQRQAIAIFDIRIGNEDRNWCNIQIDDSGGLHPIDHDRIFYQYSRHDKCSDYSTRPLSKVAKKYIRALDLNKDVQILREYGVEENEIKNLAIRTTFLKLAAKAPKWRKITLQDLERVIEKGKLPTSGVGQFIQRWIFNHPWHKILNQLEEPYSDAQLRRAFETEFYAKVESVHRWSWLNYEPLVCKIGKILSTVF